MTNTTETLKSAALAYAHALRNEDNSQDEATALAEALADANPRYLPALTVSLIEASLDENDDLEESASWAERAVRDL